MEAARLGSQARRNTSSTSRHVLKGPIELFFNYTILMCAFKEAYATVPLKSAVCLCSTGVPNTSTNKKYHC